MASWVQSLGTNEFVVGPEVISPSPDRQLTWDGTQKPAFQRARTAKGGIDSPLKSAPAIVSSSASSAQKTIDVLAVAGANRGLRHGIADVGGCRWQVPPQLGPTQLISAPQALSLSQGQIDVFCVKTDSRVVHASLSSTGTQASEWKTISDVPAFSPVTAVSWGQPVRRVRDRSADRDLAGPEQPPRVLPRRRELGLRPVVERVRLGSPQPPGPAAGDRPVVLLPAGCDLPRTRADRRLRDRHRDSAVWQYTLPTLSLA